MATYGLQLANFGKKSAVGLVVTFVTMFFLNQRKDNRVKGFGDVTSCYNCHSHPRFCNMSVTSCYKL